MYLPTVPHSADRPASVHEAESYPRASGAPVIGVCHPLCPAASSDPPLCSSWQAKCRNMEHALREKAKAFWAMRRSYEAISKHNQVSECSGSAGRRGTPGAAGALVRTGWPWLWLWT